MEGEQRRLELAGSMWTDTHALSKILVQRSLAFSFSYIRETPPHPLPPLRRPPRAVDATVKERKLKEQSNCMKQFQLQRTFLV
jgi:hypothetical protein